MVRRTASAGEIRAAFRALIGQWHPDVAESPEAHHRSAAIIQAYRTLSDPHRRAHLDRRQRIADAPQGHERRRGERRRACARKLSGPSSAVRALTVAWALVASLMVATSVITEPRGDGAEVGWLASRS